MIKILELPSKKQIQLMIEMHILGSITANFKNKLYHNYFSTFRSLEDLTKKGWVKKIKNKFGDNSYVLTLFGHNLLVGIGFLDAGEFLIE